MFAGKDKEEEKEIKKFIKNVLGFSLKNVYVYKVALTSRLVQHDTNATDNNERLEYLGDTVMSTVVADFLYHKYLLAAEGFLTEMRSKIVSRVSLGRVANKMGLSSFLKERISKNHLEMVAKSANGDAFEALIGAIYIDKGFDFTKKIIVSRILQVYFDLDEVAKMDWNFKGKLLILMQRKHQKLSYEVEKTVGSGKDKQYHVVVKIDDKIQGRGIDYSIKAAEQVASEQAYYTLTE
ncbi:ribonuclease 3 [Bacteroidia bacterium]|nr:ribonuclease 3 [Bacteroidia bacterium]